MKHDGWAKHILMEVQRMEQWYVIQVRTGKEQWVVKACDLLIDEPCLSKSFIPFSKRLRKYRGEWVERTEILFPGYVFMISDDPTRLYQALKKIPDLTKMLGKNKQEIYHLPEDEVTFLKSFGEEEQIVDMSTGYIEGDKIIVECGPLRGKEGLIRRIDRHKRIAEIEIEFLGEQRKAKVGLEIVRKNI